MMEATTMSSCMTFDCVIRAVKLGKSCARPHWPEGDIIYVDNNRIAKQMVRNKRYIIEDYIGISDDMMARDWIIPIKDYRKY